MLRTRISLVVALLAAFGLYRAAAQSTSGQIIRGDVSGDGKVTSLDALAILSHVVGKPLPAGYTILPNGDTDGNGQVTSLDALVILSHSVGKDVSRYPVGKGIVTLAVTPGKVSLTPGGGQLLSVRVSGVSDTTVLWRTNSPSVATVDEQGNVAGVAEGQAVITVLLRTDTLQRDTVRVNVVSSTTTIAPVSTQGGTVTTGAGDVSLAFPAGAVANNTTVAVRPTSLGQQADAATVPGTLMEYEPSMKFNEPVTLTVRYDPASLPSGVDPATDLVLAKAVHEDDGTVSWHAVPGSKVDPVKGTVTGEINSFSHYSVVTCTGTATTISPGEVTTGPATGRVIHALRSCYNHYTHSSYFLWGRTNVNWSIADGSIAELQDATGTRVSVVGRNLGKTVVHATEGGRTMTAVVTVTQPAVQHVLVKVPSPAIVAPGESLQLRASAISQFGTVLDAQHGGAVSWRSETPAVATVTAGGMVTGVSRGEAVLVAASGGKEASVRLWITDVASVEVLSLALRPGETAQLTATPRDRNGVALEGRRAAWQANGAVSETGVARAFAMRGAAGVIAAVEGRKGSAVVWTVEPCGADWREQRPCGLVLPSAARVEIAPVGAECPSRAIAPNQPRVMDLGRVAPRRLTTDYCADRNWTFASEELPAGTMLAFGLGWEMYSMAVSGSYPTWTVALKNVYGDWVKFAVRAIGAPVPASVTVEPGSATLAVDGTRQLVATVRDASGNPLTGSAVSWSSSSGAVATVSASGLVTAVAPGTATITATAGGKSGSATITVTAGAAAAMAKVAGDNQSAVAGTAVATVPSVRVTDARGNPVPGVTVTFAVASGGGALTGASPTTDANGTASVGGWTLGSVAGENTLTASASGTPGVTFTATGTTPGKPRISIESGDGGSAMVGSTRTLRVKAVDANGGALAGQVVTWAVVSGGGSLSASSTTTNGSGTAETVWTLGSSEGSQSVTATAAGLDGSPLTFTVTATAGLPAILAKVAGDDQSAVAGTAVATAPSVRVTDGAGNPVAGVTVTFAATGGGGSVSGATQTTSSLGIATVGGWTLGTAAGTNTLTASAAGLPGASFTATGTAGPAAQLAKHRGDGGTAPAGATRTLQARVTDANGNPVSGHSISWEVTAGAGTLAAASSRTDADGIASVGWTLGTTTGTQSVSAAAAGLSGSPLTFSVTATSGGAARLVITGSATQAAGATQTITVTARDLNGNTVADYTGSKSVTFSGAVSAPAGNVPTVDGTDLGSATTLSFSNGVATAALRLFKAETAALAVSDGNIGSSGSDRLSVAVSPGALAKFGLTIAGVQTSGVAFSGVNTLTAQDAYDNPVSTFDAAADNVTLTSTLSGTVSGLGSGASGVLNRTGDFTAGVADLTGKLVFTGTAGTGTFTATSGSGKTGTSGSVTLAAGTASPSTSTISASPTSIVANGSSTSTITVRLKDAGGNNLTASGGTVTLSTTGGTLSAVTDHNNGTYTAVLTSPTTVGTATISGTINGSAITSTVGITFTAGAPTRYVVTSDRYTTTAANVTAITAQLVDANNNPVRVSGRSGTWSSTNGGTFTSTTGLTGSEGTAAVNFTTSLSAPTSHTVTFTDTGGLTGTSPTITVEVGAASPSTSTITANPTTIPAGGSSTSSITVQLKDHAGNNLTASGGTVTLSTTLGTLSGVTDNNNGTYGATLTSATATGTATISGAIGGSAMSSTASVGFTAGAAAAITKHSGDGGSATVGTTRTLEAKVTDANGIAIGGHTVNWAVASGGGSVSAASSVTNSSGIASVVWTLGTTAGSQSATATASGLSGSPLTYTVSATAGTASTGTSTITASPTSIVANGSSTSGITVQLKDQYGNNLTASGGAVTLSTTLGTLSSVVDNNNGTYGATLTSATTTGTATISGAIGGSAMSNTASVGFTAGATGPRIVFESVRDGNSEIYSMNADGSDQVRLTSSSSPDYAPLWRPDRGKIAWTIGSSSDKFWTMNPDGSGQTYVYTSGALIYHNSHMSWSPDGTKIAFSGTASGSNLKHIFVKNLSGGNSVQVSSQITDHTDPSWSPDGSKIVMVVGGVGTAGNIAMINADGTGYTHMVTSEDERSPKWSPDGTKILFERNYEVYTMNPDFTGVTRIGPGRSPDWSPDGTKIVYMLGNPEEVYTMNPDGTNVARLTNNSVADTRPRWK